MQYAAIPCRAMQFEHFIFRSPIGTEHQIPFPFLYNSLPRDLRISRYQYPRVAYVRAGHLSLPALYFDSNVNPISSWSVAPKSLTVSHGGETFGFRNSTDDELELPAEVEPSLVDGELFTETAPAIALGCRYCHRAKW